MMTPDDILGMLPYLEKEDAIALRANLERYKAEIDRLSKVVDQAVPIVREYTRDNPKFLSRLNGKQQDPLGAHAWLEAAELERRSKA